MWGEFEAMMEVIKTSFIVAKRKLRVLASNKEVIIAAIDHATYGGFVTRRTPQNFFY